MKYTYLLLALIFLIELRCNKSSTPPQVIESIRPVKYMTISEKALNNSHTFSGQSQAQKESNLSFRVAGTVSSIDVKVGQRVNKGQILARLDPSDYSIQLKQAQSQKQGAQASEKSAKTQIKSAEANYISAKSNYQRIEKLFENNSVSLSEFEQSKAGYEAAKASFDAAKAQYNASKSQTNVSDQSIQNAQNQVSYTRLTAPFSGVISNQMVEQNELVGSGTPVLMLSTMGKPEVLVGVPENFISGIEPGMDVDVKFSTMPDKAFTGKISEVGYSLQSGSTYPITVVINEEDNSLRPGMPANVSFKLKQNTEDQNKIIVPAAAIGEDGKGQYVLLLEPDNDNAIVKKAHITIGKLFAEGFEVTQGLSGGEKIATAGLNLLQDGDRVRL